MMHIQTENNPQVYTSRHNAKTKMNVNCMRIRMELSLLKFRARRSMYTTTSYISRLHLTGKTTPK